MIDNLDLSNVYQTLHFKQNLSLIRQLLIFCYWDKYFKCNCDLYLCVPVYLCNVDKIKSDLDGKSMCLDVSADKVVPLLKHWLLTQSWFGLKQTSEMWMNYKWKHQFTTNIESPSLATGFFEDRRLSALPIWEFERENVAKSKIEENEKKSHLDFTPGKGGGCLLPQL